MPDTPKIVLTDSDLPAGLSQPALRALTGAGILRLKDLKRFTKAEVKHLHGVGPNALKKLNEALAAKGLMFKPEKKAK